MKKFSTLFYSLIIPQRQKICYNKFAENYRFFDMERKMNFNEGMYKQNGIPMTVHCLEIRHNAGKPFSKDSMCHYHEYIELLWGLEGETEVLVSGEVLSFSRGELFIINSMEPHCFRAPVYSKYKVIKLMPQIIYNADQTASEFKYILPFLTAGSSHPRLVKASSPYAERIEALINTVFTESEERDTGFELSVKGALLNLFSLLLRSWSKEKLLDLSDHPLPADTVQNVTRAMEFASKNLQISDERTLAEVAGYSTAYFSRCFSALMGMTLRSYLIHLRLARAELLISEGKLNLTEIAEAVGYSTSSHFASQFKRYKGCTPGHFKKLSRK
jgi:AraC-like DNA-binding protein